ncbi:hypothetical protein [Methanolobus halotolerans]|uniref:hypothetical protein n=1 Tax=Methanolobus halotolerans TaxID=2052935 RepID=UPI001F350C1D|nr:hypothetical protein [Methanolobus halotolerans]
MTDLTNLNLTKALKDTALEMNSDLIGFADPECFYNEGCAIGHSSGSGSTTRGF